jgi:hypothetical protein
MSPNQLILLMNVPLLILTLWALWETRRRVET